MENPWPKFLRVSSWKFVVKLFFDERRETNSAKRAGIPAQNPKKIKKNSPFLTPYFTMTYALNYPLNAVRCTLFFEPNAQFHPFIERRYFSAPRSEYGIFILILSPVFSYGVLTDWVLCSFFMDRIMSYRKTVLIPVNPCQKNLSDLMAIRSTKNIKLCKTNPISKIPKMF